MNAYELGQLEVHVDAFPGLMPLAYVEGKAEVRNDLKKRRTKSGKTKPGHHWVDDPSKKNGGYWRKNKKNTTSSEKQPNKSARQKQRVAKQKEFYKSVKNRTKVIPGKLVSTFAIAGALSAASNAILQKATEKSRGKANQSIQNLKNSISEYSKTLEKLTKKHSELQSSNKLQKEEINKLNKDLEDEMDKLAKELGVDIEEIKREEFRKNLENTYNNSPNEKKSDSYELGKFEVRNDLKKRRKRSSGFSGKTKPGHHWVDDPSKKNGGYWRKNPGKKTAALIGGGLTAAALGTAGVVALLRSRRPEVKLKNKINKAEEHLKKQTNPEKPKNLKDLEQEIVTEAQVKKAEEDIKAREKKKEEERKKNEAALQREVEKQMGNQSTIEQELEELKQERSEKRTAEIGSKIPKYTGQSDKRVPIIRNKSGDVDISATIESFGVGKPDTPVVDMNAIASSVREEVNNKVEGEYSQSLSKLTAGHNTSFGNIISRARNFAEPGFSEKNQERLVQRQIRTGMQISQFNKQYETAKQGLDKTVDKTLEQLASLANEAQRTARSIDSEVMKTIQQGLDTSYMKGRFRDISTSVKQLIPSVLTKKTSTSMTEEKARKIIIEANKAFKSIGKKELRYVYREEQNDSNETTLKESVVSFIRTLPSYIKVI